MVLAKAWLNFAELEHTSVQRVITSAEGLAQFKELAFGNYFIHCRHPEYVYVHEAQGKWALPKTSNYFFPGVGAEGGVQPEEKLVLQVPGTRRDIRLSLPYAIVVELEGMLKIQDVVMRATDSWYVVPSNKDGWEQVQAIKARIEDRFPRAFAAVVVKTAPERLPTARTISTLTGQDEGAHYLAEVQAIGRVAWRGPVTPIAVRELERPLVIPLSDMPTSTAFGSVAVELPTIREQDRHHLSDKEIRATWDRLREDRMYHAFRPLDLTEPQVLPVGVYKLTAHDWLITQLAAKHGSVEIVEGEHKHIVLGGGIALRWMRIAGDQAGAGSVMLECPEHNLRVGGLVASVTTGFEGFIPCGFSKVTVRAYSQKPGYRWERVTERTLDATSPDVLTVELLEVPRVSDK